MKIPLWLGLVSLLTAGCNPQSDKSTSQATNSTTADSGSVITAPVDYLGTISKAQQKAVKTVDTTSIDKAIQLFQVDQGRNPTDLNELVQTKYLSRIPDAPYGTKISYDAATGKVTLVKQQ
ncbi:MAG: hypothetical protein QOD03_186 [Verrucomicrobiota bacterium]|jgi:hypothetical protein